LNCFYPMSEPASNCLFSSLVTSQLLCFFFLWVPNKKRPNRGSLFFWTLKIGGCFLKARDFRWWNIKN
jgi:hypothetical protein